MDGTPGTVRCFHSCLLGRADPRVSSFDRGFAMSEDPEGSIMHQVSSTPPRRAALAHVDAGSLNAAAKPALVKLLSGVLAKSSGVKSVKPVLTSPSKASAVSDTETGTVQKARHQARAGDEISGRIVSSASRSALDSAEATDEEAMAALRQAKYKQASRRSWSSRSSRAQTAPEATTASVPEV